MNSVEVDFRYHCSSLVQTDPDWSGADYGFLKRSTVWDFHRSLPGYEPTPLRSLPEIAARLGLAAIRVKDESGRFGIKAFKALGASYAMYQRLTALSGKSPHPARVRDEIEPDTWTFAAATDGNHGRAVAWAARLFGQSAVIYMPKDSAPARVKNIELEAGEVRLIDGTFDDCVRICAEEAARNGWEVISDTAYPGYMDVPRDILLGYMTLFREMEEDLFNSPEPGVDMVLLPAGVGGIAAAGSAWLTDKYGRERPQLVCVEPLQSDCFLESARFGQGEPRPTRGQLDSIMAGLNCGIPSPVTWPLLRDSVHHYIAISDKYVKNAMRLYADSGIVSGESGAAGLAGLLAMIDHRRELELPLNADTRVLLLNTEGDTDPENYLRIIHSGASQ